MKSHTFSKRGDMITWSFSTYLHNLIWFNISACPVDHVIGDRGSGHWAKRERRGASLRCSGHGSPAAGGGHRGIAWHRRQDAGQRMRPLRGRRTPSAVHTPSRPELGPLGARTWLLTRWHPCWPWKTSGRKRKCVLPRLSAHIASSCAPSGHAEVAPLARVRIAPGRTRW